MTALILGADGAPLRGGPRREGLLVGFPEEKLREWAAAARAILAEREGTAAQDDTLVALWVLTEQLAERMKNPPRGRAGLNFLTRALPVFRDTRGIILSALARRRKQLKEAEQALGQLPPGGDTVEAVLAEVTADDEAARRARGTPRRRGGSRSQRAARPAGGKG